MADEWAIKEEKPIGEWDVTNEHTPGIGSSLLQGGKDFLAGIGSGAISTGVGAYNLARKIPGVDQVFPEPSKSINQLTEPPSSLAGKAGHYLEQGAEYLLPGGAEAKEAGLLKRAAINALENVGVNSLQTGGDLKSAAIAGTLGAVGTAIPPMVRAGRQIINNPRVREAALKVIPRGKELRELGEVLKDTSRAASEYKSSPKVDPFPPAQPNPWEQVQQNIQSQQPPVKPGVTDPLAGVPRRTGPMQFPASEPMPEPIPQPSSSNQVQVNQQRGIPPSTIPKPDFPPGTTFRQDRTPFEPVPEATDLRPPPTQMPVPPSAPTPVQTPATPPTVLSTAKGASAAEALKNTLVPGSPPGKVATISGSDTREAGQVAHMLNRAKKLGLTSESVQTLSPAEKVKVVDLINQSPHTPSVKSQIMDHLGLGDDIGQFAKGGVVSPGDKYDTKLTPQEETQFQQWKKVNAPHDSGVDYDLRGAFKGGANPAQNGHFPDTWKKPNHPTFSNESKYATQDAPHWEGNRLIDKTGKVITDESPQIQGEEPMPNPKVGFITPMAKGGVVVPKTVLSTVKGADARSGEDIIRGSSNIPLSPKGVQQAKELGGKFKAKGGVHHIDSSHLKRAVQTADAIHETTGAPIRSKLKELSPWHLGEIEGQPTTQVLDRIHKYVLKQPNVKVPGMGPESTAPGESFNTFKRRFLGHLEEKLKELKANPSLKLAQVTHYRDVRLAQAWAAKGFPKSMEINPKFMTEKGSDPPGSVLRLFWKGSKPSLVKVNMDSPDKLPGGVYLVRHGVTCWNQENKEKK